MGGQSSPTPPPAYTPQPWVGDKPKAAKTDPNSDAAQAAAAVAGTDNKDQSTLGGGDGGEGSGSDSGGDSGGDGDGGGDE